MSAFSRLSSLLVTALAVAAVAAADAAAVAAPGAAQDAVAAEPPPPIAPPDELPERVRIDQPGDRVADLNAVEDLSEELAERFLGLARALRARDLVGARAWFADGFVGQSVHGMTSQSARRLPLGARQIVVAAEAAPVVDGEGWLASWGALLGEFGAVEQVRFTVKGAEFSAGDAPRGRVRFRVSVEGSDPAGGPLEVVLWAAAEVVRGTGPWRLAAWAHENHTITSRATPIFSDVSVPAGVAHDGGRFGHGGDPVFSWNGAAVGELDGDGLWDLFVPSTGRCFLYRNNGDGTFAEVSEAWGLGGEAGGTGALFVDLDEDGDDDLLVAHVGWMREDGSPAGDPLRHYRNEGDRFVDVSAETGFDGRHVAFSLTAGDLTGDGLLDVYVSNANRLDAVRPGSWFQDGTGTPNALYVGQGDGTWRDEAAERGADHSGWTYAAAAHDPDEDGDLDLYLANADGDNALLMNQGGGLFLDRAALLSVLDGGHGTSASWGDLESDGDLDLYVANVSTTAGRRILERLVTSDPGGAKAKLVELASGNSIYAYDPARGLEKQPARQGGVDASWAWASCWGDLDLDGDEDVMVANGFLTGESAVDTGSVYLRHVVGSAREAENARAELMELLFEQGRSFSGSERDKVFLNDGSGRFVDVSSVSGADHVGDGRALVQADFDDDGDLDVFLHNIQGERHALLRNDAVDPAGRFVKVRLEAARGSRSAAGAIVHFVRDDGRDTARVQAIGSGFVSQSAAEHVFGVAGVRPRDDGTVGELSVAWLGGVRESFGRVKPGARVRLLQGTGRPVGVLPQTFAFAGPGAPGVDLRVGERLGSLAVLDADGEPATLELADGRETLLHLWATTCSDCVAAIPALQRWDERDGRRVVGLSVDLPSRRARAPELLAERGARYANWFVDDAALPAWLDLDQLTLPTTLRLAADGELVEIVLGAIE